MRWDDINLQSRLLLGTGLASDLRSRVGCIGSSRTSLHALLLGCLRHHARTLWGMNVDLDDQEAFPSSKRKRTSQPSEAQIRNAWRTMRHGSDPDLERLTESLLRALATCNCPLGRRQRLLEGLKSYVSILSFVMTST